MVEELEEPSVLEVVNGYIIDTSTGEVVGIETPNPVFMVDSDESANWVLGRMLDAESSLAAVDSTEEVIRAKAVLANAEAIKKERQRRIDYLHFRFDNELGEWAKAQLEGQKSRTWKTLLGSVSLRSKKGGPKVKDQTAALAWAKTFCKEAVKTTETFLISLVPKGMAMNDPAAFETVPDQDTVTVKTGVEK